jgi:hypothetical protein
LSVILKNTVEIGLNREDGTLLIELTTELNRELNKVGLVLVPVNIEGIKDLNNQKKK